MNRKLLGDQHPGVVNALENLAALLEERGAIDEARELFFESLQTSRQIWGAGLMVADTLTSLAHLELSSDRPAAAEPYFAEALELTRRVRDADHPALTWLNASYGYCLFELGRYEESERALLEALSAEQKREEQDAALLGGIAADLVALYEAWGHLDEAAAYRVLAQGATHDTEH